MAPGLRTIPVFVAGLMVRIRFPPAESRTNFRLSEGAANRDKAGFLVVGHPAIERLVPAHHPIGRDRAGGGLNRIPREFPRKSLWQLAYFLLFSGFARPDDRGTGFRNHRYRVTPPRVREGLMSPLLNLPRMEKSARTKTRHRSMPGVRGLCVSAGGRGGAPASCNGQGG
jgi:hypothetical protein